MDLYHIPPLINTTSTITPHNPPTRVARGPDTTPRAPSLLCSGAARSHSHSHSHSLSPSGSPVTQWAGSRRPPPHRCPGPPTARPAAREAVNEIRLTFDGARSAPPPAHTPTHAPPRAVAQLLLSQLQQQAG